MVHLQPPSELPSSSHCGDGWGSPCWCSDADCLLNPSTIIPSLQTTISEENHEWGACDLWTLFSKPPQGCYFTPAIITLDFGSVSLMFLLSVINTNKKQLRKTAFAREADLRGPMAHQGGQAWCQESETVGNTADTSGGRWRNMNADVEHIFLSFIGLRSYPKRWYSPQRSGSSSLVERFWKFPLRHSHSAKSSQVNYQNQLRGTLQDGTLPEWAMRGEADSVPSSIRTEDHGLSDLKQKCVPFAPWQTEAWNLVDRAGLAWVWRKSPL